jgi:hypothetical protein
MVGPGLFIHGGVGMSKISIDTIMLNDWAVFDVGLFCWIRINVRNIDGLPNTSLARKMHTMSPLISEVGGLEYS